MDRRTLPSTLSPATIAELSPYPPSAAASDAAILQGLAPTAFAQLQNNLSQTQQHSRVTALQANHLAQDEATIIRGIESSGLIPSIMSADVAQVQETIDSSFIELSESNLDWLELEEGLEGDIGGTKVSLQLIHRTTEQMYAAASATGVTSGQYVYIQGDLNALGKKVAADSDLNLSGSASNGNSSTPPNPVQVYYDSQVIKFIK